MTNCLAFEEQSNVTTEFILGPGPEDPVMERFRRALNRMVETFQSDLPSEDFLSQRILELAMSSRSIESFFQESMTLMDEQLAEHRRQAETMRASLRVIHAFLTSFVPSAAGSQQQFPGLGSGASPSLSYPQAAGSNVAEPSESLLTPEPSNALASLFVQRGPAGRRKVNQRGSLPPDIFHIPPRQNREDISVDVLEYYEGPLVPPPPSTPSSNPSTPIPSGNHRSHPFILRQVIRRRHLIRTPDGRIAIPGQACSPSRQSMNTPPPTVRPRVRRAESSPYTTPRRSVRRLNSRIGKKCPGTSEGLDN